MPRTLVLAEPWDAVDTDKSSGLEDELRRELSRGHPLHGRGVRAIARRYDQDDVLFALGDGEECAVVHLTWSGHAERAPWPSTRIYPSVSIWQSTSMADDQRDFSA
jgi:hypothetical protein